MLLHGFPEFWYGWRHQIGPLAAAGFRVVAPDLRGYNLSSKPRGSAAYRLDPAGARRPAADRGARRGAGVRRRPRLGRRGGLGAGDGRTPRPCKRLAILDSPHPRRFKRGGAARPRQAAQLVVHGRSSSSRGCPEFLGPRIFPLEGRPARIAAAWAQPGALTAMINYCRAIDAADPDRAASFEAPTLVIWGAARPRISGSTSPSRAAATCPNLDRIVVFNTSHWVQHEAPEEVSRLLAEFFALP